MPHSADRLKVFVAMATVFQILISLLALPGQTGGVGTTDNSSLLSIPYIYNTLSEDVTPKPKNNTRTFGVNVEIHERVSTTGSHINSVAVDNADRTVNSDIIHTFTDAVDNSMDTGNIGPEKTPSNTMNVDNIASESVHEQSDHHIMYTGFDVTSANVRKQTPRTITNRGNVAAEAIPGQFAETTKNTGNVASLVNGIVPVDIVARYTVPGQTADSQTVTSATMSAVNSGRDQTVTADSGNIGTVPTSVQIRRENEDLTSESVFTSTTVTTVTTAVSTLITTSLVTPTQHCEAMLCEKDAGYFVINTTACAANDSPTLNTSIPTTVKILTNVNCAMFDILCYWNINVPDKNYINVTIDQLVLEENEGDDNQTLEFYVKNDVDVTRVINISVLRNRSVTFTSSSSLFIRFRGHDLHLVSAITFHFLVQLGSVVEALPVVRLTDTVSYVTSPWFNGLDRVYPKNYEGEFHLHLSEDQSVFISFTHFVLEENIHCKYDYLEFEVTAFNQTWRKCGQQDIPPPVVRSSVHLFFHSDYSEQFIGFKMMYAILPRSQEPQQLSDNLYNCSVPHFHSFKPLLSCNMVTECQGNEDEEGCGYHSNDCGDRAVDAGTKCFRFVRRGVKTAWRDANYECSQENTNLVMPATPEEFRRLRQIMRFLRNPRRVYIGAHLVDRLEPVTVEAMYKHLGQWIDGRTAIFLNISGYSRAPPKCIHYSPGDEDLSARDCRNIYQVDIVCQFDKPNAHSENIGKADFVSSVSIDFDDSIWNVSVVQCPSGHVTRDFLSCDTHGQCGSKESMTLCYLGSVAIAMFVCERSHEALHYTLVCDRIQHCDDNTDEDFCEFSPCPTFWFRCQNSQCINPYQQCDDKSDCFDGSDEICDPSRLFLELTTLPPAVLDVDITGQPFLRQMKDSEECPVTHFQCSQGFCLPIYLRCNGVDDCPNREDEASCESYSCSGFYRCRRSKVCLHADHVCDGVFQCPQYDDELLCEKACPDVCQCQGLAFVCTANFSASSYPALRYLDASGSGMSPTDLTHNLLLMHLRLSDCSIDTQPTLELPNLRHLDLSGNELTHIDMQYFRSLKNLRVLVLSGNPLSAITNTVLSEARRMVLQSVNLSGTSLDVYNGSALAGCPNLKTLNISWNVKLTAITDDGFQSTPLLENLDVRGSPLKDFPSDLLRSLFSLKVVYADHYKLCCEAMLPEDFNLNNCHAEQDLLASCKDLLKSNVYRAFLWLFASLSVVGNVGSFVVRLCFGNKGAGLGSFGIFVTYLSIADFFMGIYLAIVGVADQVYRGKYLWYDDQWKQSAVCKIAGFLSLMSSEVSAFIICLITLDRFLALRFPFSRLHFSRGSALIACAIVWVIGIALAIVPLLPLTSHWEYYSQTGICIPLPFATSEHFQGYDYSFSVMILLNFVLFLLIAVGQAIIYWSVRSSSLSSSKKTGSRDATIARRLTTIVLSDFLCWFPIGLLGVLASTGTPIPGEVSVAVAIFVMPFNSALNPFLYTYNVLMEKRRKAQEANLLKRLETQLRTEQTRTDTALKVSLSVDRSSATEPIQTWLTEQVLSKEDVWSP